MEQALFCNLRREAFEALKKRVYDFKDGYRQNIALLGDELTGKTSLLKLLLSDINDETLIPVYVDVVPYEYSIFLKRCINSLLYNFLKKSQLLSARENLEMLIKRAKEHLPKTTQQIDVFLEHINREKPDNLFKELFSIFECFNSETQKKCIIILDEFHNLKQFSIKNVWQELGKRIMFEKHTLFIFASSAKLIAEDILANELTLLFGNFETIELAMLNTEQCVQLIKNRLATVDIPREIMDFLINFTGGHPFYLKAISDEAASACQLKGKNTLDQDILSQILQHLFFNEWGLFNQKFTNSLSLLTSSRNKNEFIFLLGAIASGKNRLKDLSSHFRKNKTELNLKLKKLIELDIIGKNGSFYHINDRLMSFWLKFVLVEKINALDPEYAEQELNFRKRITTEVDEFIKTSKQDVADRMLDLFNRFEDDSLNIDKKRFQLSSFREIKIVHFDNTDLRVGIFAKAQDSLWLAAIKEDGLGEHDVNEFLLTAKKFKHKTINKLIISLGGIERNAKLLAKQSQISTWDIANINSLLDLYGKPRIIK